MTLKLNGTNSEAAPAYAGDDADTGLQCGTDELKLVTGGTARATVDSSGNFGIGTSAPSELLHLAGATNPAITLQDTTNNTDARIKTNNNGDLVFEADYNNEQGDSRIGFEVDGSEKVRIDSSGRLLLGTSSDTTARFVVKGSAGSGDDGINVISGSTTVGSKAAIFFSPSTSGSFSTGSAIKTERLSPDGSDLQFYTCGALGNSPVERMRITSAGALCINNTGTAFGEVLRVQNGGSSENCAFFNFTTSDDRANIICKHAGSSGGTNRQHIAFLNSSGSNVGSIKSNGSATSYNTSSDYRLKENVVDLDGAITRVKQLAPKRFNFIADAETTVDGFLAHEAQTVVPEAVTGTHNEVDGDDNPVYQGIDQSKLVPLLTAALQEAIAKIETLETKVAALEAAS